MRSAAGRGTITANLERELIDTLTSWLRGAGHSALLCAQMMQPSRSDFGANPPSNFSSTSLIADLGVDGLGE